MRTKDEDLMWHLVQSEHIVRDQWLDLRKETYKFPDGSVHAPFYTYSRKDYVVVAAECADKKWLLVRQFRQGIRNITMEFPAGGIEKGELPEKAAERELLEETGYRAERLDFLLKIPSNATESDNMAYLYLASGCHRIGTQKLDSTEFLQCDEFDSRQIEQMIQSGEFSQAVHLSAWLLSKSMNGM